MDEKHARFDVYLYVTGRHDVMGTFMRRLLSAWEHADGVNSRRLEGAFPEIGAALTEYSKDPDEYIRRFKEGRYGS